VGDIILLPLAQHPVDRGWMCYCRRKVQRRARSPGAWDCVIVLMEGVQRPK